MEAFFALKRDRKLQSEERSSSSEMIVLFLLLWERFQSRIQTGFQLQAEGKIPLKNYSESTDSNSLFQSKGYSIKYESIRRTKLYQQLKP